MNVGECEDVDVKSETCELLISWHNYDFSENENRNVPRKSLLT